MDPISMLITGGLTAASMFMSISGSQEAAKAAKQQAALSSQNAGLEMQVDEQRRQMMEISAKRQMTEQLRNIQRARSMSLSTETSQGAQFGSVVGGAQGAISGQGNFNLAGINQSLAIGRNIFGLNESIDRNKIQIAALGGQVAEGQGEMAFGQALGSAIPALSNLGTAGVNAGIGAFKSLAAGF